jgi:signal transduction histidine kinase
VDAFAWLSGHNDGVAGVTGRLIAFFARAEPRGVPPTGWALTLDAAVAVGAAMGAVYEMAERSITRAVVVPAPLVSPFGFPLGRLRDVPGQVLISGAGGGVHPSALLLVGAAMTALPLAVRRFYPIAVWLAIATAIVGVHSWYVPPVALGAAIYAAYSAITHSRYRNLSIAVVSLVTIVVAVTLGDELPRFPGRFTAVFAILAAGVAGIGIRVLRRRLADSTARLRRAAEEAKVATEQALTAERARIASELHDVVTHNVSVMIVQAGAARKILASSPADAEDALLAVEATGREAMTELRNLLGLLSPAADGTDQPPAADPHCPVGRSRAPGKNAAPATLLPQPGLGELDALIGRVRAAGLRVTLTVTGTARALPSGADLAAYRVVQEGLTNVLRHAGQASASVAAHWGDLLELTVTDDGQGTGQAGQDDVRGAGHGRGLLGLRERLALYGGELEAGPRPDGGWRMRAVLPLTAQAAGPAAGPAAGLAAGAAAGPAAGLAAGAAAGLAAGLAAGPSVPEVAG